jgi:hypothetical protein
MKEQLGKYYIDLSKLVFGGAIISAIMKENISLLWIVGVGTLVATLLAFAGFRLVKNNKNN